MFKTGGILTGDEIERQIKKGNISITPFDPSCINPNSINLKLHPELLIYKRGASEVDNSIRTKLIDINSDFKSIDENNKDSIPDINETGEIYLSTGINGTNINCINGLIDDIEKIATLPSISSYDLEPLDMKKQNETIKLEIPEDGLVLQPGILYIGRTVEKTFSDKFVPMINGRSSGGRLGMSIHITAGFGDIGFNGSWTLEITVVEPLRVYPNTEVCQVSYYKPYGKIKNLYRGRYQNQESATASRFYMNKKV